MGTSKAPILRMASTNLAAHCAWFPALSGTICLVVLSLMSAQVPVVLVVEVGRRGLVLVNRHRVPGVVRGAPLLQPGAVLRVHGLADGGVYPVREGRAVSAADGVRAGERDQLVLREPLGGEELREAVEPGERRGQAPAVVGRG